MPRIVRSEPIEEGWLQPRPAGFQRHVFERTMRVRAPHAATWACLNRAETFTDGQVPPFRVEFVHPDGDEAFVEGVYNVHHGPLMNFAGVLGAIEAPHYRDLPYFYGSYVLSLRWIRPARLQFWLEPDGEEATQVRLRVDSLTRPWIAGFWTWAQRLFWSTFPGWVGRESRRLQRRGLVGAPDRPA